MYRFQKSIIVIISPEYPNDIYELERIQRLLDKIPIYEEKIRCLTSLIDGLSSNIDREDLPAYLYPKDIADIITKSFFIDIENKPHYCSTLDIHVDIRKYGLIKNRNISCEICGENRAIDKCHIIPKSLNGPNHDKNYLYLCPTHHRLFDRFMLSKDEWCRIDWSNKFEYSQVYAMLTIYEHHKKSWQECYNYQKLELFEINNHKFIEHLFKVISECLPIGFGVCEKNFFLLFPNEIIDLIKIIIKKLVKDKVIYKFKQNKKNTLLLQEDLSLLYEKYKNIF